MSEQLTRFEQLRLEALNQAVTLAIGTGRSNKPKEVTGVANTFLDYLIYGGEKPDGSNTN